MYEHPARLLASCRGTANSTTDILSLYHQNLDFSANGANAGIRRLHSTVRGLQLHSRSASVAPVTPVLCRLRCSSGRAKQAPEQAPACVPVLRAPAQPPAVVTMASNKRSAGAAGHVGGGAGSPSGPSQSGAKRQRQAAAPEKSAYVCWLAVRQARQSQTPIWWHLCVRVHAFVLEQVPGRVGGRGRQGFRPYVMAPPCPCAV